MRLVERGRFLMTLANEDIAQLKASKHPCIFQVNQEFLLFIYFSGQVGGGFSYCPDGGTYCEDTLIQKE